MSEKATLTLRGKTYELPVLEGTEAEVAIDISSLRAASGAITLDEAFGNTGSCKSAITFIDGEEGILRYRGYPIEQLAEKSTFLEVGVPADQRRLPEASRARVLPRQIAAHTLLHEDMKHFFAPSPRTRTRWRCCFGGCGCRPSTPAPEPNVRRGAGAGHHRLLAKLPTIAAMAYRKSRGLPIMYPDNSLGYSGNFLRMMFGFPTEPYACRPGDRAHAGPAIHPARRS
jgi:citrate synthase